MTAPTPVDARPDGEIEAEVGVGEEEDSDVVADQSSRPYSMARALSPL